MRINVRYAQPGDYDRICQFSDTHWVKDHVYVRKPELFEWTFRRNSQWDHDGYSLAIAEMDGEVVGMLGGIPFTFNCLGQSSRGLWLINYVVRRDGLARGLIAIRLLSMMRRPPYSTVIGFGFPKSLLPTYRAMGAKILSGIPRHLAVLPGAVNRMANVISMAYSDWPIHRARAVAQAFSIPDLPDPCPPHGDSLPATWDQTDWPRFATKTIGAARDSAYLVWRYLQHPCFTYRLITVSEGEDTGLAIWRLETIRRMTPLGLEEVDRIGRLVEFLPTSRQNAKDLLAVFWRKLEAADAMGADYYGHHGEIGAWLREAGFLGVGNHPDGEAIPFLFQPLDGRNANIPSAIFALKEGVPMCSMDSTCEWYWTKSDADGDRPN